VALETTEQLFDDIFDADLKGAFFLAQYTAKAMIATGGGGRIINLLSVDAFRPMGILAKELAPHQILVNAITPGATITKERLALLSEGTFASGQVPTESAATRAALDEAVNSGSFAQRLTTMMPLGRPAAVDQINHPEVLRKARVPPAIAPARAAIQSLVVALTWWANRPQPPSPAAR
jgi:NAD(P)-dependent dehydrogenase (short-subunit alcohol dehydrogenase family)